MLIALAPYLLASACAPPGAVFSGCLFDTQDFETYLFKMRRPAELGGWLWENWYDPDFSGRGAPLFLFYALLGKLARLAGVDYVLAYHLARALLVAAEACLLVLAARRMGFPRPRLLALLALFGGGAEWALPLAAFRSAGAAGAEAYLSYPALALPHFVLAQASLVAAFLGLSAGGLRGKLAAAAALSCLALVHPHLLPPVALAEAAFLAVARRGVREAAGAALAFAPGSALGAWLGFHVAGRPDLRAWASLAVPPPDPARFALVLWLPLCLAACGYCRTRRADRGSAVRAAAWALAPLAAAWCPLPPGVPDHRERLLEAAAPWLWLFASRGWVALAAGAGAVRRAAAALLLAALLAGPARFCLLPLSLPPDDPVAWVRRDEAAAFAWLRQNAVGERVLAPPLAALRLPSRALCRPALAGHWAETPGFREGLPLVREFFDPSTSFARRAAILRASGARWVLWRADLRARAEFGGLAEPVWRAGSVEIWAVQKLTKGGKGLVLCPD